MSISAAFITPHPPLAVDGVGNGTEKSQIPLTMKSFDEIAKKIAEIKPDTIILTTPHSIIYNDYFHVSGGYKAEGDFTMFGSPVAMEVTYDDEFISNLERFCEDSAFPAGLRGEQGTPLDHGTMVPLYFINKYYRDYDLVRISLSGMKLKEHFIFGKFIKKIADSIGKNIVFIASGDMSHYQKDEGPYGYRPEGVLYDEKLINTLKRGKLNELLNFPADLLEKAGECGHRSFCILAGALYDESIRVKVLSHENTFGVGYGVVEIEIDEGKTGKNIFLWEESLKRELEHYYVGSSQKYISLMEAAIMEKQDTDEYVWLARKTINALVLNKALPLPDDEALSDDIKTGRAGAFVSLHKEGALRGCIGTIIATKKSLSAEVIANAVAASTQDPRFPVVTEEELPYLEINVDVLTEPVPAAVDDLDPKKYGIIVQSGHKMGVLLPDLEGVDTVSEQLSIAKNKAGISEEEDIEILKFTVERHK